MMLSHRSLLVGLCAVGLSLAPAAARGQATTTQAAPRTAAPTLTLPDIPYQKFVLPNGLRLIVHEDRKAPIVAVNVWYHVGSKNEKVGKTGFAHLFEHIMFNGSENYRDDFFKPFDRIGATDQNGTTNADRTNYFQNVPTPAVDVALWLESDRMGHLLGAVGDSVLNEQRGVVQNEKRQGENNPYGRVFLTIAENTYPRGHPYSWTTIGSMEDLNAASLEDVKEWFREYYGAANAVIVLAGDIDAQTAKQKVEKFFGDIPSGPPVTKQQAWVAKRTGTHRMTMQDRVPQGRVYKVYNVPEWGSATAEYLDIATDILAAGKSSRLYKRLVYTDQIATDVAAFIQKREIGSQVIIWATAKPGQDLAAVERAMDEELTRFIAGGPTVAELNRSKTQQRAQFVRGIERIGGFGGKSDILALHEVYGGSPDSYKQRMGHLMRATVADVQRASREWLSDGAFVLEVHPFPQYQVAKEGADRSKLPEPGPMPAVRFPQVTRATLSNGLKVVLVERPSLPVVNMSLRLDAGYAADQFGRPGTASLAMNMLDEGTRTRDALRISDDLASLGATLFTGSNLDMSFVTMSALKENLDPSLSLFTDVVLNPSFPTDDLDRLRRLQIAQIQREKVTPVQMALRVYPALLYGDGHAYGNPLTGSGTEASVAAITRDDLVKFHQTWFKPNHATLIVVGATTMSELQPKLEAAFRGWRQGDIPQKNIAAVQPKDRSVVYLIDRPGSQQSIIFAGNAVAPRANPDEIPFQLFNEVLGAGFSSRVNMNLRESKHWSYGAYSILWDARGPRPFVLYAPVQTDKTKESMAELSREVREILKERPPTADELARAMDLRTLVLPGQWETNSSILGSLAEIHQFGLPEDYFDTLSEQIRKTQLQQLTGAASKLIHPDRMVWVVVGDRSKIEAGVRELKLGEVRMLDADGKPVANE